MIGLEVADDGLDRLASLEQCLILLAQCLGFAPVLDVQAGVVFVHPTIAQVYKGRLRLDAGGLHQDGGLLDLFVEGVAVIRVTGEGPGTDDQVALEGAGQAHLDAEFEGVAVLVPMQS